MSEAFKVGDIVRVMRPDQYNVTFARKVRDRDAVIERIFTPQGGTTTRVRVRFLKRNGRGKEFIETMLPRDIELSHAQDPQGEKS